MLWVYMLSGATNGLLSRLLSCGMVLAPWVTTTIKAGLIAVQGAPNPARKKGHSEMVNLFGFDAAIDYLELLRKVLRKSRYESRAVGVAIAIATLQEMKDRGADFADFDDIMIQLQNDSQRTIILGKEGWSYGVRLSMRSLYAMYSLRLNLATIDSVDESVNDSIRRLESLYRCIIRKGGSPWQAEGIAIASALLNAERFSKDISHVINILRELQRTLKQMGYKKQANGIACAIVRLKWMLPKDSRIGAIGRLWQWLAKSIKQMPHPRLLIKWCAAQRLRLAR